MSKRPRPITKKQVAAFLHPRPRDSHKGLFGTAVIIGGANGMAGAPLIAARAALKLGAGCVHVGLLADDMPQVDVFQPELMLHRAEDALARVHGGVLALGCGMGIALPAQKLLIDALHLNIPLVLDADALNLLARHPDLQNDLRKRKASTIITPHPGEAARLLGSSSIEVQAARVASAKKLAGTLRCAVALKGADSIIVTSDSKLWRNTSGNSGMSSAGMGDALTGMIASLLAQGLTADQALLLGVHLHGAAGDALQRHGVGIGMTASEVIEWARWLRNQWMQ
jgi:hydroxyethylthiazole kinase-like uncharacterized protein yjeF